MKYLIVILSLLIISCSNSLPPMDTIIRLQDHLPYPRVVFYAKPVSLSEFDQLQDCQMIFLGTINGYGSYSDEYIQAQVQRKAGEFGATHILLINYFKGDRMYGMFRAQDEYCQHQL